MDIQLKELEYCKYNVVYTAGVDEVLNKRSEILNLFKKAPISGFRQGKAPIEVIKRNYKDQIEESLKRGLLEEAYHNVVFDKKLRVFGPPQFTSILLVGNSFTCELILNTKPEINLSNYKNMEVPKPHEPITTEELSQKILQEMRVRAGETLPYSETDFIQSGDNVIINYETFCEGQRVDNLCLEGELITIGNGRGILVNFESNLLGMNMGEVREFDLTAPSDALPSIANKVLHFTVTLVNGSKTVPAALDDELAKKMEKNSFAELQEFVGKTAMAQISNMYKSAIGNSICAKLLEEITFKVPDSLKISEAQYLNHAASKTDWNTLPDSDKEKYLSMAENNVKLSLIFDAIRSEDPEALLTDQECWDMIKENIVRSKLNSSVEEVIKGLEQSGKLQIIMTKMKEEYTLNYLIKSTRVIE